MESIKWPHGRLYVFSFHFIYFLKKTKRAEGITDWKKKLPGSFVLQFNSFTGGDQTLKNKAALKRQLLK